MNLETFFRAIVISGVIAIVIFVANAASAKPTRPQLSSKVIRIEKKTRKPIKVDNKIKFEGKEFDSNDPKLYDNFWSLPLEEQRKYPRLLRIKFVETRRYRRFLKQNPPRKDHPIPPMPPDFPYEGDEWALTKGDKRGFTRGQKLQATKYGKASSQSKIGNKTINLEVR